MDSAEPQHVFIRNAAGQVWGPIALPNVEQMFESGEVAGPVQVSQDGVHFVEPGRMPSVRGAFPRETWGAVEAPPAPAPPPKGEAPIAGPGAMAAAAARAAAARAGASRGPPPVLHAVPAGATPPKGTPAATPPGATPPRGTPAATAPSAAATAPRGSPAAGTAPSGPGAAAPSHGAAATGAAARGAEVPSAPVPQATGATTDEKSPPPSAGELGKLSPIHLYYLAASSEQTGLLSFKLSDRTIEVHFRKGNPEYVSSTHPDDSLPHFLRTQANVTAQQMANAEGSLANFGGDLVAALFGLGILNPGTAFAQLAQRATSLLLRALVAESGTFTYEPKDLPAAKAMPLGSRWAVLSEQVRRIPVAEMKRRLQDALELPLMKSGGRVAATDLRLTPQETRALALVDGVRSLAQLTQDLPADADTFVRLAFYLRELEILSFAASTRAAPKSSPGAAPPSPEAQPSAQQAAAAPPKPAAAKPPAAAAPRAAAPARPPTPAPVAKSPAPARAPAPAAPAEPQLPPAQQIAQLQTKIAKLKDLNLFEVLELTEKADSAAVKTAYFKLARTFHPDTVAPDAPAELGKLKAEYFAKVGEAYRRLGEDASRAQYLDELKNGGGGEIDVAQILLAEELFQKGMVLIKGKRFEDGVRLLNDAIKGNPEEGEFFAWRGYAKFFLHEDKKVGMREAQADLQTCLRMNERVAQAHYFLGFLTKLMGDNAGALKHFKRTLELRPDHVDAQREVRLASKK